MFNVLGSTFILNFEHGTLNYLKRMLRFMFIGLLNFPTLLKTTVGLDEAS